MWRAPLIALCCMPLCLADARGEESVSLPGLAPEAREITDAEVAEAQIATNGLPEERQLLINGLRYLLRPGFEAELMAGRAVTPCDLPPFEQPGSGPLTQMEALRLWAVLQSGVKVNASLHVARLLETPAPGLGDSLSDHGVLVAACLEVHRAGLATPEAINAKASQFLNAAMKERSATDSNSKLINGMVIEARWFANHMWRGLICRAGHEMGLKFNVKVWENDLRNLAGACEGERGWASPGYSGHVRLDLDANLLAMAAVSLALQAPEKLLGSALVRSLQRVLKDVPRILARLEKEFPRELISGGRLALVRTLSPDFAPEGRNAAAWQSAMLRRASEGREAAGSVRVRHRITGAMGLGTLGSKFGRASADTALTCIALSGGVFRTAEAPLAAMPLAELARAMHAFAVVHAASVPPGKKGRGEVDELAEYAIEDGCAWLERRQEADGGFGSHGYTGMALLALLHGGRPRDGKPVQAGLKWIMNNAHEAINAARNLSRKGVVWLTSYEAGILLMMFQKYYEPEQLEAGVLSPKDRNDFERARERAFKKINGEHGRLINALVTYLDDAWVGGDQGGWSYAPGMNDAKTQHSDNSISQYAILGYKSASLLGARVNVRLFLGEAQRALRQYAEDPDERSVTLQRSEEKKGRDGKTQSSTWQKSIQPGGWGYTCIRPAGKDIRKSFGIQYNGACIATLAIARDELEARGELPQDLAREIDLHVLGAQAWIARHYYPEGFTGPNDLTKAVGGTGVYYNLYSVERGMVLAGIERMHGDVDWYDIAARGLIDAQEEDGHWLENGCG